MSCAEGDLLIQAGGYLGYGWALTNSAFSYATAMTTESSSIPSFFSTLAGRYAQFLGYGFLDQASLDRVLSVLGHHCAYPSTHCAGHRFPGSMLPSAYTAKVGFLEAELAPVTRGASSAAPSDASASGGKTVKMPIGTGSSYWIKLPFSVAGPSESPRLYAVLKSSAAGDSTFEYRVDGGTWTSLSPLPLGTGWDRRDLGVPLGGLSAGAREVQLRRTAGPAYVYLDAAFLAPYDTLSCALVWPVPL